MSRYHDIVRKAGSGPLFNLSSWSFPFPVSVPRNYVSDPFLFVLEVFTKLVLLLSGSAPRNALGAVSPSTQLVQTWNKHKAPSFSGHSSPLQPCKAQNTQPRRFLFVNYESSSFNHSHRIVSEQTAHESFTASAIYGRFDGSG